MKKRLQHQHISSRVLLAVFSLVLSACQGSGGADVIKNLKQPDFPSSGEGGEGADNLSSTTNFSQKVFDPRSKADALAGATVVPRPQVSNFGGVSTSYPMDIPAGRAGLAPQVSLQYSSSGGDGIVGVGWSLSTGLASGAITRTTQYGQLLYDKRDVFSYGGKRLVKVSGSSQNENGIYRLEIESGDFLRLELNDVESGGVWTVRDRSGSVTTYGLTSAERIYRPDATNKTYSWQFSRREDLNGNFIVAVYDTSLYDSDHVLYLKEIRYTGHTNGQEAKQYVRFSYKTRDEAYISRAPGFAMQFTLLLDEVTVGWKSSMLFDTNLWSYRLVYSTSPDSSRPLLATVDSSKSSTRPRFNYLSESHYLAWQLVTNPWALDPELNPDETQYFEGDFNGDGLSDMVFFNPKTGDWKAAEKRYDGGYSFKTYGNRFKDYDGAAKIQFFKGNVSGDYNGDGRSDIAFYLVQEKEFWVAEHNGSVFNFKLYGKLTATNIDIFKAEWFTGDYDGNGLSDVVLFDETTGQWLLMLNVGPGQGNAFQFQIIGQQFKNLFRDDYSPNANLDSASTRDTSATGRSRGEIHFFSGDFNGDGRSDISFYDGRTGKWFVGETSVNPNTSTSQLNFRIEWKLYKIFTAPEKTLFGNDRFAGDFNGDGLTDVLLFDRENGTWWLGETQQNLLTGTGTINFRKYSTAPQFKDIRRWLQGDFNGDGRTDVGFYSGADNNFWIAESTPSGFRYRIYNNLSFGPDPSKIFGKLTYPEDEIHIAQDSHFLNLGSSTQLTDYKFDGNTNTDRGELPFVGCFSASPCPRPEALYYNRAEKKIVGKQQDGALSTPLTNIDFGKGKLFFENEGINFSGTGGSELLFLDNKSAPTKFQTIHFDGSIVSLVPSATFQLPNGTPTIQNFDASNSVVLADQFAAGPGRQILILDDQDSDNFAADGAAFHLLSPGQNKALQVFGLDAGQFQPAKLSRVFSANGGTDRFMRNSFRFLTGKLFGESTARVIMVDMRGQKHIWYTGVIDAQNNKITFEKLNTITPEADVNLPSDIAPLLPERFIQYSAQLYGYVYATKSLNGAFGLSKVEILQGSGGKTVQITRYGPFSADMNFLGETDHQGRFLFRNSGAYTAVTLGLAGNAAFENIAPGQNGFPAVMEIDRPDLSAKVYPFQWIQGDYNGDGKTDIGIFHLKEPQWYFANTVGIVPDLLINIENGIGGTYDLTYANSTSFDNRHDDGLNHLPVNYKVCTRIVANDGQNNTVATDYAYKKGYAFSKFIAATGRKEVDYFGFSEFQQTDSRGNKTIQTYNTIPFANYLHNRALAGAPMETRFIGVDNIEYSRSTASYKPLTFGTTGSESYMVELESSQQFMRGVLTQSTTNTSVYDLTGYHLNNRTQSMTDHYADSVRTATTLSSFEEIVFNSTTNEQRLLLKKNLPGTAHEVTTILTYDGQGNVTDQLISYTGSGLASVANRSLHMEYDAYGNLTAQEDRSASPYRRIEKIYDSSLHQFVITERNFGDSITISRNYTINYGIAFGAPEVVTDPNGFQTQFEFDSIGRIKAVYRETDAGLAKVSEMLYSTVPGSGSLQFPVSAKTTQYSGLGSTSDVTSRVYVDGFGREIHTVMSAESDAGHRYVKTGKHVYDGLGRIIRQGQRTWAQDAEIDEYRVQNTEINPTIAEYDPLGRVTKTILPPTKAGEAETSATTIYNDPWEIITKHASGQGKRAVGNARGQVLLVEDFGPQVLGGTDKSLSAKIGFCFDLAGNRIKKMDLNSAAIDCSVTAPMLDTKDVLGNNIAVWEYNAFGQVRKSSDPDFGVSLVTYNAFGDVISTTDAKAQTTNLTYDRLGRVTKKALPNSEGDVFYTYDSLSGVQNAIGKVVRVQDPASIKTFSYDAMGRVKKEIRQIVGEAELYETNTRYDLFDRISEIDYPRDPRANVGMRVCYRYNNYGLVAGADVNWTQGGSGCSSTSKPVVTQMKYNEFGQLAEATYGNGITKAFAYDIRGRVDQLEYKSQAQSWVTGKYEYALNNSITSVTLTPSEAAAGANFMSLATIKNYSYDGLNRLVHSDGHATKVKDFDTSAIEVDYEYSYKYALNGNLTEKNKHNPNNHNVNDRWTYSYTNHAVTSIVSNKYLSGSSARFVMQYDAVGNMTQKSDYKSALAKTMGVDSYNRIRSVLNEAGQTVGEYKYDDQGFRIKKISRGVDATKGRPAVTDAIELTYPSKYFGIEIQKDANGAEISKTYNVINNIYVGGLRVASVIPPRTANTPAVSRYFFSDQVDSVHVVADDTGKGVTHMEYLPYGETWFQEPDKTYSTKYNSQELDKESKFYFYNARHYDPELARFTSADSMIDGEYSVAGWNAYTYTANNPIGYSDPTGHEKTGINPPVEPSPSAASSNAAPSSGTDLLAWATGPATTQQVPFINLTPNVSSQSTSPGFNGPGQTPYASTGDAEAEIVTRARALNEAKDKFREFWWKAAGKVNVSGQANQYFNIKKPQDYISLDKGALINLAITGLGNHSETGQAIGNKTPVATATAVRSFLFGAQYNRFSGENLANAEAVLSKIIIIPDITNSALKNLPYNRGDRQKPTAARNDRVIFGTAFQLGIGIITTEIGMADRILKYTGVKMRIISVQPLFIDLEKYKIEIQLPGNDSK